MDKQIQTSESNAAKCVVERKIGVIAFPIITVGFLTSIWYYWL